MIMNLALTLVPNPKPKPCYGPGSEYIPILIPMQILERGMLIIMTIYKRTLILIPIRTQIRIVFMTIILRPMLSTNRIPGLIS